MQTNIEMIKPHPFTLKVKELEPKLEIIFAVLSGILIFAGWLTGKLQYETASVILFIFAYVIGGFFKAKEGVTETIANKSLNVEFLMIIAAIGSAIIGYWEEGAILIFIFAVSGALEAYTTQKSHKELTALMELQPTEAWLIQENEEIRISVEELQVGDMILIKPGEQVPADGVVVKGKTSIDESAITGESVPVLKGVNDEVFAGTVNGSGAITVKITKPNNETLFQKIITLVESAQTDKSPSQQFIERFEAKYVYIVLITVGLMMFLPHYLFDWSWNETFYRAMILLVVASPCAVVASITPAILSAISNGARNGILFKGGVHLEKLGNLKVIALDKTGTLTKGKPEVTDFIVRDDLANKKEEILQIVASIENHSNHPLAQAIVRFAQEYQNLDLMKLDYVEDVTGYGIQGKIGNTLWRIGKKDFMAEKEITAFQNNIFSKLASEGKTVVLIQREEELVGLIALKDVVRSESKRAIQDLKNLGVKPIMLTGDNENTAKAIAQEIGIDHYIAECLPEKKLTEVERIKHHNGIVAMVGDGINDAPALATSDVGIAMGEGTDVALETADVVLMKNELTKISKAVTLSKQMNRIIKQNLIFSIIVMIILICSNFFQAIDLPLGVIGHEGSTILVILNSWAYVLFGATR